MAKKAKKEEATVSKLTEIASEYDVVREYAAKYEDKEYVFHIKEHIAPIVRSTIVDSADKLYFDEDKYDPNFGDEALRMLIAQQYTGELFENDVDVFEKVNNMFSIWGELPSEAHDLWMRCAEVVDYKLNCKVNATEALQKMYDTFSSVGVSLAEVLDGFSKYLDKAEEEMGGEDVSVKEIVDVLKSISKKDEQKIANAVLDYQAEKAKRKETKKDDAK